MTERSLLVHRSRLRGRRDRLGLLLRIDRLRGLWLDCEAIAGRLLCA